MGWELPKKVKPDDTPNNKHLGKPMKIPRRFMKVHAILVFLDEQLSWYPSMDHGPSVYSVSVDLGIAMVTELLAKKMSAV